MKSLLGFWLAVLMCAGSANVLANPVKGDVIPSLTPDLQRLVDLTTLALTQNKLREAEQAGRQVLEYVDKNYKKKPERAEAYNLMAAVLFAKGDLTGAFDYHNQALKMMRKALGKDHPRYAQILVTRAGTFMTLGLQMADQGKSGLEHFKNAEADLLEAQRIFKRTRPEDDRWAKMVHQSLAKVQLKIKQTGQ